MALSQSELKKIYIGVNARLPSEYQEVEYIQSSGTQRIDTGYAPTTSTEFEIDYEIVSYIAQYATPFGTRYAHNNRGYYIGYENDNTSFYDFGSNKVDPSTVYFHGVGTRRKITYHNNVLSNGSQSVTVSTNQTPYGTIRIFCEEQNGSLQEYAAIKLYSFKLREGSTLTRDFVPCYRIADSVIGLYDIVNNTFYTNAGTGTFTKGNDIKHTEIKKAYLGSTQVRPSGWKPGANTLAYYPLETDTKDYSGNGRDGTNSNVTFSNGIATFNGSNAMVSIPHATRNQTKSNMTISAWFNINSNATGGCIIGKWQYTAQSQSNFSYGLSINSSGCSGGFSTGNDWNFHPGQSSSSPTKGEWHLITLTNENGNSQKMYLDKTLIASSSSTTNSSTASIPLTIGNVYYRTNQNYFTGNIAKVILEDKTWGLQDISDYYDNNMPS